MSKLGKKLIKSVEEAINYAKGNPAEGTKETYYSHYNGLFYTKTFENGKWVEKEA